MRVCVHRGAREIGGSCVEVAHDGQSLFLDAGLPLDVRSRREEPRPPVKLLDGSTAVVGLVLTHGHPDHWGLVRQVSAGVPVFLGAATQRILSAAARYSPSGVDIRAAGHLDHRVPFRAGSFTVTPHLVDHSAFDAYALLVEAGGKRLLYSGDLRAHGRKSSLFDALIADPPQDVEVLLLEGTTLGRPADEACRSEEEVERRCATLFGQTEGLVLAAYSAQNIDRLVSIYRAARAADRTLVIDLYTAEVARATGRASIPQSTWDGVRVFVPDNQRVVVKRSGDFRRVNGLGRQRIFAEEIADQANRTVLTFRGSMIRDVDRIGNLDGAAVVWSMWPGYLRAPSTETLRAWLASRGIPLHIAHASGHATPEDLRRLACAVGARRVVPIHTEHPEDYMVLFDNVSLKEDGQWWTV